MRRSTALLASVALAVLVAGGAAWAAAGDLDPTFGSGDGQVVSTEPCFVCTIDDVAVLPGSGKIVAFGADVGVLARYNPDGSLDETFGGGDGKLTTDVVPGTEGYASAVDLDAEGRAVAGGAAVAYNSSNDQYNNVFGLARYLLD